jgi:hypothetical protein
MTTLTTNRSKLRRLVNALLACCAVTAVAAPAADAEFGIVPDSFHAETIREFPAPTVPPDPPGDPVLEDRAGVAPGGAVVGFDLNRLPDLQPPFMLPVPDGALKNVQVDLPAGLVGNPQAVPTCTERDLRAFPVGCPAASHIGQADVLVNLSPDFPLPSPVYNMETNGKHAARFGFVVAGLAVVFINADLVEVGGEYRIRTTIENVSQLIPVLATDLTLWGVPADHNNSGAPRVAFLRMPTKCAGPLTTSLRISSYTGETDSAESTSASGLVGCDEVPFDPSVTVTPDTVQGDTPTGLRVDIEVPQTDDPSELASGHLDDAVVTLPAGMSISPALATGLQGCSDAQLGGGNSPAGCPDGSKIGTVEFDSPLLADPVAGEIFLGSPTASDPYRLFLVGHGPGFTLKLRGSVAPNPQTGQLVTTFANNPELPFTRFSLQFKGGPRAPLSTPPTCGPATTTAALKPHSGATPVSTTSTFVVSGNCAGGFNPTFVAGALSPVAGDSGGFTMTVRRPDGDQTLGRISLTLPPGLTGRLASVPLCAAAQAASGACGAESRVGSTVVEAGAGPQPFPLAGAVYLTEGYGGGQLGLAIVVRAIAGPFDLGTVVVRAAVHVDERDAHLAVVSDPLPTILQGIPLRLRTMGIDLDRPGFMLNPTGCGPKQITATLASTQGAQSVQASPFAARGCSSLEFTPKMTVALTGRGRTKPGRRPGLRVKLTQDPGEANSRSVELRLPRRVALDPTDVEDVCTPEQFNAGICPAGARVGSASARTPLLANRLAGPVHLVAQPGSIPGLGVTLQGQLRILLEGKTDLSGARVKNTFASIPDVPIREFNLSLAGGPGGILTPTRDLCKVKNDALLRARGQNGKRRNATIKVSVPCGKKRGGNARRGR